MSRIEGFLDAAGWAAARRLPLAGDASARRYERLLAPGGGRAVLMDVPPESGLSVGPFLAVTGWLRTAGLSAPEVLAAAPEAGLLLLEDFGDDTFARLCAAPAGAAAEPDLYAAAIDTLAVIHALPPPAGEAGFVAPPYDAALLLREARLVLEWYLPAAGPDLTAEFEALVQEAIAPVLTAPAVPVMRDYHAENLLWLPSRRGTARVGLLDYQDLLAGHRAYDLVSLLDDARRDVSPELRAAMTARYRERTGSEAEALARAAAILSAQRNLKILGLFARLARRDGKPRYLALLPRVWGHLGRTLGHPDLAPLGGFVARHLPPPDAATCARLAGEGAAA